MGGVRPLVVVEADPAFDHRLGPRPLIYTRAAPADPRHSVAHVLRPSKIVVETVGLQRSELGLVAATALQ